MRLPQLFTSTYFAEDVLSTGEVVPVRVSFEAPIIPLEYPLEDTAETLVPEFAMLGEWNHFCQTYLHKLEVLGVERIGEELSAISARYDGRPLALLDYEDLRRGLRNHRIVFSHWWEQRTGHPVFELTNGGERLHFTVLPKQVQPMVLKPKEADPRYRSSPPLMWPLTLGEVEEWLEGRYWQQARSRSNPHAYTLRRWNDERAFELIVLFIREHGYEAMFSGAQYTQFDCGDWFYWTMGHSLPTTVVLNRKQLPDSEPVENIGDVPAEPGLFHTQEDT